MAVVRVRRMEGRKKVRCIVVVMESQLVQPLELLQGLDENAENGKPR